MALAPEHGVGLGSTDHVGGDGEQFVAVLVELGVDPNDREALLFTRSSLVTASAAAGKAAPIDGVTTALREPEVLADDVRHAARLGLTGELCIHPSRVPTVHECLTPNRRRDRLGAFDCRGCLIR
ncbi:hypothetical protein ABLE92_01610 [Gordonia sp. VNQ95]|uniref:hypothetical protein n=1 Tax=Gordonia sp. VNQ95 TaxID=3156619 RepID=UPI0032B326A1